MSKNPSSPRGPDIQPPSQKGVLSKITRHPRALVLAAGIAVTSGIVGYMLQTSQNAQSVLQEGGGDQNDKNDGEQARVNQMQESLPRLRAALSAHGKILGEDGDENPTNVVVCIQMVHGTADLLSVIASDATLFPQYVGHQSALKAAIESAWEQVPEGTRILSIEGASGKLEQWTEIPRLGLFQAMAFNEAFTNNEESPEALNLLRSGLTDPRTAVLTTEAYRGDMRFAAKLVSEGKRDSIDGAESLDPSPIESGGASLMTLLQDPRLSADEVYEQFMAEQTDVTLKNFRTRHPEYVKNIKAKASPGTTIFFTLGSQHWSNKKNPVFVTPEDVGIDTYLRQIPGSRLIHFAPNGLSEMEAPMKRWLVVINGRPFTAEQLRQIIKLQHSQLHGKGSKTR